MSKYTLPLIILALTACAKNTATNETLTQRGVSQTRRTDLGVVGFTDTFATGFASQVSADVLDGLYEIEPNTSVTLTVDSSGDEVYVAGPLLPNCPVLYSGLTVSSDLRYRYDADFFGAMSTVPLAIATDGLYSVPVLGDFFVLNDNPTKPVLAVDGAQFDRLQILIDKSTGCMSVLKRNRLPN